MPVSDYQMVKAWDEVLKLSKVERGQKVSILCGPHTHPQTLQTATIVPARMTGMADRTGSVTKGKSADLILVDGDVSKDITNLRHVDTVN